MQDSNLRYSTYPKISVLKDHELQQIRDMSLASLQNLHDIHSRVTAHTYDLDAIMHIHQASLRQT